MIWFRRHVQLCLALTFAVGLVRIVFYYLIYEPLSFQAPVYAAASYQGLQPFLVGAARAWYVSDEPLDEEPTGPREHDRADMAYARAQYALAPTLLARSRGGTSWIVADFSNYDGLERFIHSNRYIVIARATPAIALLRMP